MASKITTVSLNSDDIEIIEKYNLSPTALIKERIAEFREAFINSMKHEQELQQKITRILETMGKYRDFLERKGLLDEFLKEQ